MAGEISAAIDALINAARDDGWQADQGTGDAPQRAAERLAHARNALLFHLGDYDTGFGITDEDLMGRGRVPDYVSGVD